MQQVFHVKSIEDWQPVVNALVERLAENPQLKIVLLEGNLGAGKTTFVQLMMQRLGGNNLVQSPTFSLVNEYKTADGKAVYHLDLYRLKDQHELIEAGILDTVDSGALCFIEWSGLVEPFLGNQFIRVHIVAGENENRTVTLQSI